MLPAYAELHCLSNYTFLRGASDPEELVRQAWKLGYQSLAITDECSLAGVVRAHSEAMHLGLKLIVGSEFILQDGLKILLLAANLNGYGNLCELITLARSRCEKGTYAISREDLYQRVDDCLLLWCPVQASAAMREDAAWLAQKFEGRCWIVVELLRGADDDWWLAQCRALSAQTGLPLVAAGDVHMHVRRRRRLQNVVTAIRLGKTVAQCGTALYPNGERYLRPIGRLAKLYPVDLLIETLAVAERCRFSLTEIKYEYPQEVVPAGESPASYLRRLAYEGVTIRYPQGLPDKVRDIIEYELALISEMGYEPYFLTVYDIVKFARERGILCQGRGSAANSAVCYCLGITEVDPGRMSVLFERFISKERNEPPDIDVDFEHERREEVIQYLFAKYGRDRAAITATVSTYHAKGALRDVGKALGFSLDQVDRLSAAMTLRYESGIPADRLAEAGLSADNDKVKLLVELGAEIVSFPRHQSQHTGGFVLDNRKLTRLVPVEPARMENRTIIQWDKYDLDALGLMKVDVLGLGIMTCIRKTLDLVNGYRGTTLRMQDIPAEDPKVYDMLCQADTIGLFQVESRAQMARLPTLKPRTFYDLVIEVAIVRPGPIKGGMVHPYLNRRAGREPVTYPSEEIKHILERTLGVTIFQEQVMAIAIAAAGFTPGEADQLRRAMAAWKRKGGLEPFKEKLIKGMLARGYEQSYAEQIFEMVKGFGDYGFPESHAASFALLVYVSAWLKCHEPAAYAAGLLNSQPLGFYSPAQIIYDAQRHGVEVYPVDVLKSDAYCQLVSDAKQQPAIRLGLKSVKGLSDEGMSRLVQARDQAMFVDLHDLKQRAQLNMKDMNALADADAFANLAGHRRDAMWTTLGTDNMTPMLRGTQAKERQPWLLPPSEGEDVVADYAHVGLTLRSHPLKLLRPALRKLKLRSSDDIQQSRPGQLMRTTGIVINRQRPDTASGVVFATLEDEYGLINITVWRNVAERYRVALTQARLLTVYGTIERDTTTVYVVAGRLVDHSNLLGGLATSSRDFH
ncbi:MAG: error-prone DNA polymerase [Burkholderiales bacterium]